MKVSQNIIIN